MATLKDLKKQYAAAFGTKHANELFAKLEKFEDALPMGITLSITRGTVNYVARTSYVNPVGVQVKISLGTFSDLKLAITSLFKWKLDRALKDINPAVANEIATTVRQMTVASIGETIGSITLPALTEVAAATIDSNHLAILSAIPPFEIPEEGDLTVQSPFDGVMTTIPEATIAEWYRQEQERADMLVAERYHETIANEQFTPLSVTEDNWKAVEDN